MNHEALTIVNQGRLSEFFRIMDAKKDPYRLQTVMLKFS